MNQASSSSRTWPSRWPSRRSSKPALLSLPRLAAAADQAQQQRHRADREVVAFDHRRQAQPALAAQEFRPVRLGIVVVMHQRARRLGGDALDHAVIDHAVPDRAGWNSIFSTSSCASQIRSQDHRPCSRNQ